MKQWTGVLVKVDGVKAKQRIPDTGKDVRNQEGEVQKSDRKIVARAKTQ